MQSVTGVPSVRGKTDTIHSCSDVDPSSTASSAGRRARVLLRLLSDVEGDEEHGNNDTEPVLLKEGLLRRRLDLLARLVDNDRSSEGRTAVSYASK